MIETYWYDLFADGEPEEAIENSRGDRKKFNWHDEDLPAMRLKMAMEVFANSIVSVQ